MTLLAGEETLKLEVQVEYMAAAAASAAAAGKEALEGLGHTSLPGRRLSLPVQLQLQPAVQVHHGLASGYRVPGTRW